MRVSSGNRPIATQLHWDSDSNAVSNMPEGEGLPAGEADAITAVERVLSEQKGITFMGGCADGKG
jgi:hypothetical protein